MKTGMKAQSMRLSNTSLVLKTVLSAQTPISRTVVADQTGLTRATVSRLVDSLIDAGLLYELEPERSSPGRPSYPLQPTSGKAVAIGIDISTDRVSLCLMDFSGDILDEKHEEGNFRNSDPAHVMERVTALVDELSIPDNARIIATTLCIPGICTGTEVRVAPNLGWRNVDLEPLFTPTTDVGPLRLMNEADAGGYATLYQAPGRQNTDNTFAYISGNVGVGSAMFFDGNLLGGRHGWAGEFGHICVDPAGPRCACTSNGCLEQYAGYDAILASAGLPANTKVDQVREAFDSGDYKVRGALDRASTSLGRGIATIVNLLDIDVIVVGGQLATLLDRMSMLLNDELEYRVLGSRWSSIVLHACSEGSRAAMKGACYEGFAQFIDNPLGEGIVASS